MDEIQAARKINISIDLLSAAKRHLNFLRVVGGLPYLHGGPFITQAIRRYRHYWIPLSANCDHVPGVTYELNNQTLLPPFDVQWVWHCHCLNPKAYQQFCELNYSRIVNVPVFPDVSAEVSARERCKKIWCEIYPDEPFELQIPQNHNSEHVISKDTLAEESDIIIAAASQQCSFYTEVCPVAYAQDTAEVCEFMGDIYLPFQRQRDAKLVQAFENTARLWETVFEHPYERAGALYQTAPLVETMVSLKKVSGIPTTVDWNQQNIDVDSKYKSLVSRYIVEVCIQIRDTDISDEKFAGLDNLFVRLRTMKACKLLRLDKPLQEYKNGTSWHKLWLLHCEISSEGVILELRSRLTGCCRGAFGFSKRIGQATWTWKELEGNEFLAVEKTFALKKWAQILDTNWKIGISTTPPIQAPYLLRSLPDRVTDDADAMLSKQLSKHRPQEGRWMSRTVLNHAGKECFIIRIRVATGVWRSTERPVGADWNDRIIHIHEGGWEYHTGSIGVAPDKIIATAAPVADELEKYKKRWSLSTGEILTVQTPLDRMLEWERHLRFSLKGSDDREVVRLLNGRHMQYQVPSALPEQEEGFVTMVRYQAEAEQGRATALFNWKLAAMEVLPEEDVVLVMLICTATVITVADLGGETLGMSFESWRGKKGSKQGRREWGSVVMGGGDEGAPSDELRLWYENPEGVLKVKFSEHQQSEGVLFPEGKGQIYKGTSWMHAGETGVVYKMSSTGSIRDTDGNSAHECANSFSSS